MTTFGDLRSLFQRPASRALWDELCGLLDAADPSELVEHYGDYLGGHLRRWDPDVCRAPARWIEALVQGDDVPQLLAIRSLTMLDQDVGDDEILELTTCPYLENLHTLELGYNRRVAWRRDRIDYGNVRELVTCAALSGLSKLRIVGQHLRPEAIQAILESPNMAGLHQLDLSYNDMGFLKRRDLEGIERTLRSLILRDVELTVQGIEALVTSGILDGLEELDLGYNQELEPLALLDVVEQTDWGRLVRLGLAGCQIEMGVLTRLLEAQTLGQLEALDLSGNDIFTEHPETAAAVLTQAGHKLGGLRRLDLGATGLNDRALEKIVESELIQTLSQLGLRDNPIGRDGVHALVRTELLANQESLELQNTNITDEGVALLVASEQLGGVKQIDLTGASLTDAGARMLAEATLPALEVITIDSNDVSAEGIQLLLGSASLPALRRVSANANRVNTYDDEYEGLRQVAESRQIDLEIGYGWGYDYEYDEMYDDIYE